MNYPRSWRVSRHARETNLVAPPKGGQWYRITNKTATRAEVMLYDEIGFGGVTAADFARELQAITANSLDVRISSPGGEVCDGLAIYESIKRHPAHVTVYVDGMAASAASFIAQAGDRIVMGRNSQMMIHDAIGLAVGNATEVAELVTVLNKLSDNIADIYAQRAGGTPAMWRKRMRAETWYTAKEAVAAGLADEVSSGETASAAAWAEFVNRLTERSSRQQREFDALRRRMTEWAS